MPFGYIELAGNAALFIAVFVVFRRGWDAVALSVALADWLLASIHMVVPLRAFLDPHYEGYSFGFLATEQALASALLAGFLLIGAAASAAIAAYRARGWLIGFVAVFNATVLAVFGLPLLYTAATNPIQYALQFGELLSVPAAIELPLILGAVLVPMGLGVVWSVKRLIVRVPAGSMN